MWSCLCLLVTLAASSSARSYSEPIHLVQELQRIHKFENFVVYSDNFSHVSPFLDGLQRRVNVPHVLVDHLNTRTMLLYDNFNRHTLTIAIFDLLTYQDLIYISDVSWKCRRSPFVLFVRRIDEVFFMSISYDFRNSIVVQLDEHNAIKKVTRMDLYPEMVVVDLTGYPAAALLRTKPIDDWQLKVEATPLTSPKNILQIDEILVFEFFKFINASWQPAFHPYARSEQVRNEILQDHRISVPFQGWKRPLPIYFTASYPIRDECNYLVIPRKTIPRPKYPTHPVENSTGVVIVFGIFYAAFVLFVGYWAAGYALSFFECWTVSLFLTLGMASPLPSRLAYNPRFAFIVIYLILLILGFVLYNRYTALISFYVKNIMYDDDIRTLEEFQHFGSKIKIDENSARALAHHEMRQYFDIQVSSQAHLIRDIRNFNTNFSYCLTDSAWRSMNYLQRKLVQPLFKNTEICMFDYFTSTITKPDSDFEVPLNSFIMMARQHGFLHIWKLREELAAIKYNKLLERETTPIIRPFIMIEYTAAWYVLAGGLLLSALAFAVEMFMKYRNWV